MVEYAIVESTIPGINCVASINKQRKMTLDDVIDYMIAEGTGLTRPQALAYFEKIVQTFEYFIRQGHKVATPLVSVYPSIKGTFEGQEDAFDPSRHRIRIQSYSGIRMRNMKSSIRLTKVESKLKKPSLKTIFDATSREKNNTITPLGIASLYGSNLRFEQDNNQHGLFFISATGVETRVEEYNRIKPAEIGFQIPALTPGEYTLEVRTTFSERGDMRKDVLNKKVLVI